METYIILLKFLVNNSYHFETSEIFEAERNECMYSFDLEKLCNHLNELHSKMNITENEIIEILKDFQVSGYYSNSELYYPIVFCEFNENYISLSYNLRMLKTYLKEMYNEK